MRFCTLVEILASHEEDGVQVIDETEVIDISLVDDDHFWTEGWARSGPGRYLHIPGGFPEET